MKWSEICSHYPNRFVLVEAIHAVSSNRVRTIEDMTVVDEYESPRAALEGYKFYHMKNQSANFMFFIRVNKRLK